MQTVKVRVRKPTRVLTFRTEGMELKRDDKCVIRTDRGLEFGICVLPPEDSAEDEAKRHKMQVVRKATQQDETDFFRLQEEEQHALKVCKRKVEERKLPMKLVDAEFTFDKNKVIFHFTAADRVDFRDLVRDLAQELRTRIELRHIQVRDEARIVGGIGVCGRELCCSTWLGDFQPISMKMAKRQNLSLNPSKISGQCGRLLCCLAYENDLYHKGRIQDMGRPAPKPESQGEEPSAARAPEAPRPKRDDQPRKRRDEKPAKPPAEAKAGDGGAATATPEEGAKRGKRRGRTRRGQRGGKRRDGGTREA